MPRTLVLLAILAAPTAARAEDKSPPKARIALSSVLYQHNRLRDSDASFNLFSLGGRNAGVTIGWLAKPWLEAGAQVHYIARGRNDRDDDTTLFLALYADANHRVARRVVVHGGVFGGIAQVRTGVTDYDEDGWHAGAGGGVKLFATERGSIDLGVRGYYSPVGEHELWVSEEWPSVQVQLTAGISLWL